MHETDAKCLIKPVFDFFISKEFKGLFGDDEYNLSLLCFQDFVKDKEPYWVRVKAQWVIRCTLDFNNEIGECPATLKEVVLAIVGKVRSSLGKMLDKELKASHSDTLHRDIDYPDFPSLNSWGRMGWHQPKRPD